jgi:ABC-type spermidine/putrescine transport system permease subunit II
MDIYMPIIMEVAYSMAKSYIQDGWTLEKLETRNYVFLSSDTLTWGD